MTEIEKYYNNLLISSGYIPTFFLIIPISIAIWKWKDINTPLKYFFWFCFWFCLFNALVLLFIWTTSNQYQFWKPYLDKFQIKNVFFTRILFFLTDFIFLGNCYLYIIFRNYYLKLRKLVIFSLCFVSFAVYFFIDGFNEFGTIGKEMRYVFVLVITLSALLIQFKSKTNQSIFKNSFFWISIGLLIPLIINILFEFSANNLYETNFILYCKLHILANGIELIGQVFFIIGFWQAKYIRLFVK